MSGQNYYTSKKWLRIIEVFLLVLAIKTAGGTQPLHDTLHITKTGNYPVTKHLWIYRTEKKLRPSQVYDSLTYNCFNQFGIKESLNESDRVVAYYWLVFTAKNNHAYNETFYFWFNSPGIGRISAFREIFKDDQIKTFRFEGVTGFYVPFNLRQNKSFDAEFSLQLLKGETATFLMQLEDIDGEDAFFAPEFSDAATYKSKQDRYVLVMGIISGVMLAAFILNIFLGVAIKEKLHYLYAAYILFILIEILILEGIITSYLSLYFNIEMIDVFTHINPPISLILMTLVMQWFLKQKRKNSRLKIVLDFMCLILLILIAFYIAGYFIHYNARFNNSLQIVLALSVGLQVLLVMASALEKTIQGFNLAMFYFIATLFPLVGILELVLLYCGFNIVPVTRQTRPNHFQLGLVIETIIVFMAIIHRYNLNIKENVRLLIEKNEQQQSLIYRIVSAEEAERKRIAQDLHDDVASTLSTLNFHISNLPENIESKKELENYYNKGLLLSNKAVNDIRDIAHNLLPKDYKLMGLFKTLEDRIEELNKLRKIRFSLVTDGNDKSLREEFSIIVYRIINELLANILKHSIASEASVQIFLEEKKVLVMVEDDGVGFDNSKTTDGIGLKNIASRIDFLKGELKIDSSDNGTNIIIQLTL